MITQPMSTRPTSSQRDEHPTDEHRAMSTVQAPSQLPSPSTRPPFGHLSRWTANGLDLLEEGARLGPVFGIRLWRKAIVGYSPDWNRFVLGDLPLFRSRGSLSQLSPYLSAGLVATDAPEHRGRRALVNPSFHRREVTERFAEQFAEIAQRHLPAGPFDAVSWSSDLVRAMIVTAFLGPHFPDKVLRSYVAPLDGPMPQPLLRRPFRVRRMERALRVDVRRSRPVDLGKAVRAAPRRGRGGQGRNRRGLRHHRARHGFRPVGAGRPAGPADPRRRGRRRPRGAAVVPVGLDRQPGRDPRLRIRRDIRSPPDGWCCTAPT